MRDTLSPSGAPRSGEATRIYELPGRLPPIIWTRAVERSDEGVRDVALRRSVVRGHLNPAARDASDGRHRQLGAERISAFEVQRDGERLVPLSLMGSIGPRHPEQDHCFVRSPLADAYGIASVSGNKTSAGNCA